MTEHRPHGGHKARVLVVDDEETVCDVISAALADRYETVCFHDGRLAMEGFTPGRYQVAIINLSLPGMPGDKVAHAIRSADPRVTLVVNTGFLLLEDELGLFDFFLEKPFSISRLREMVAQGVELYSTRYGANRGLDTNTSN